MTYVESKLRELAQKIDCTFCKYYNSDEERDPKIPDVLEHIDHIIESYESAIERTKTALLKDYYATGYTHGDAQSLKIFEKHIKTYEELYDKVTEERNEYYFISEDKAYPILKETVPVQQPYTENGKLLWKNTGETREVYHCPALKLKRQRAAYIMIPCDGSDFTVTYADEWNLECRYDTSAVLLSTKKKYVGFENYSKIAGINGSYVYTCRCKDCGQISVLSLSEVAWYRGKGLNLPTHCPNHRGQHKKPEEKSKDISMLDIANML